MKKLFYLGGVWAIALGLTIFLLSRDASHEPSYQGIPLTVWLAGLAEGTPEAEIAVRQIGTNALPFLLEGIGSTDSPAIKVLCRLMAQQRLPALKVQSALNQQVLAWKGFQALGSDANGAVPPLTALLNQEETSRAAALGLVGIGSSEALSALMAATTNGSKVIRCHAIMAFAHQHASGTAAVVAVARGLKDDEHAVRFAAAATLGRMDGDPDIAVPALVESLHDTNRAVRYAAVEALGALGRHATSGLSAVRRAVNDPEKVVRQAAVVALRRIAAEGREE